MKRCRGQHPCEKQADKEVQRLFKHKPKYSFEETEDLSILPKNPENPIIIKQMKRNGHIQF